MTVTNVTVFSSRCDRINITSLPYAFKMCSNILHIIMYLLKVTNIRMAQRHVILLILLLIILAFPFSSSTRSGRAEKEGCIRESWRSVCLSLHLSARETYYTNLEQNRKEVTIHWYDRRGVWMPNKKTTLCNLWPMQAAKTNRTYRL